MSKVCLPVLAATLALAGCDASAPDGPVPFADVEEAGALRVQVTGTTVIKGRSDWAQFWDRHGGPDPVPAVDFDRQFVVGVFYGGSLRAGCRSEVDVVEAVERDGDAVRVRVGPLPDLGPCRAVVYPADVVVVDVSASEPVEVRFTGEVP